MLVKDQAKVNRIMELRLQGLSYAEISKEFGLTRQRIQQLIRPPKKVVKVVSERAGYKCEKCGLPLKRGGHIHHKCNGISDYNDIKNLQLLCISCHRMEHAGDIEPKALHRHKFLKKMEQRKNITQLRREMVYDWYTKDKYSIKDIAYWLNLSKYTIYEYICVVRSAREKQQEKANG